MSSYIIWRIVSGHILAIFVLAGPSARAADINVWEASINFQTKERFIPVELWTGAEWEGQKELKTARVDGTYPALDRHALLERTNKSTSQSRICSRDTSWSTDLL